MGVSLKHFESIVTDELRRLPKPFRDRMRNVAVVIEEGVSPHDGEEDLTGLYEGLPLTERTTDHPADPPSLITLYKAEIEAEAREEGVGLRAHIARVLRHEIAHHFGISDDRLEELGEY